MNKAKQLLLMKARSLRAKAGQKVKEARKLIEESDELKKEANKLKD